MEEDRGDGGMIYMGGGGFVRSVEEEGEGLVEEGDVDGLTKNIVRVFEVEVW